MCREREAEKHALEERELIRAREKLAVKRQHENSLSLSNDRLLAASAEVLEAQEKAASFDAMIVAANDTIKKLRRDIEAQKQGLPFSVLLFNCTMAVAYTSNQDLFSSKVGQTFRAFRLLFNSWSYTDNDREATLVKANHDVVQEELKRRLAGTPSLALGDR